MGDATLPTRAYVALVNVAARGRNMEFWRRAVSFEKTISTDLFEGLELVAAMAAETIVEKVGASATHGPVKVSLPFWFTSPTSIIVGNTEESVNGVLVM